MDKPVIHIECSLKKFCRIESMDEYIYTWIRQTFDVVTLDMILPTNGHELVEAYIDEMKVVEIAGSEAIDVSLSDADIRVYSYFLADSINPTRNHRALIEKGDEEEVPQANITELPSREYNGLWDKLIFDGPIKQDLLHYMSSLMLFSDRGVNENIIITNKIILLYGPPGTGKTSLCKALAQKLTIRLNESYPSGTLIEINSHSLFSKYFSESGKLVGKLFAHCQEIAKTEGLFVVILIDEVESLTAARQASLGTEPSDSLRVVNALLTQLDQLKSFKNVLVLATSNLLEAIDPAFIDRVDICQYLATPGSSAVYSILQDCINEMIKCRVIEGEPLPFLTDSRDLYSDPRCPAAMLYSVAESVKGVSGRTLRKIPVSAHARYLRKAGCTVVDTITAISKLLDEKRKSGI